MALAEFDGLTQPNAYGALPLTNNDPARPNDAYFRHVDWIVDRANALGLYVGLLPTWGDKVNKKWGTGPEIFTPENARAYGEFLGRRYRDRGIVWILGGDRPVENDTQLAIWRAMAEGIRKGDGGRHLMTYHPMGGQSSSALHQEKWLDFNMLQSSHGRRNVESWRMIAHDYNLTPVKPCLDGENTYEDHPINWKPELGYFDAYDVRKGCYWSLFAGACGYTYGCHDIWQFLSSRRPPVSAARTPWKEALHLPGSSEVQYARRLLESRPYLTRVPDQSLIASGEGGGEEHVRATRGEDGGYALIFLPHGHSVTVNLERLSGTELRAWWYDTRSGTSATAGEFPRQGVREFTTPTQGTDWVLVLDDVARNYGEPGQVSFTASPRR